MHLAKVPFKLRSSYHVRAKTHARHPVITVRFLTPVLFSKKFVLTAVTPLDDSSGSLFSRNDENAQELTQVEKRASRTVVWFVRSGTGRPAVLGCAVQRYDNEETWDDQRSHFFPLTLVRAELA